MFTAKISQETAAASRIAKSWPFHRKIYQFGQDLPIQCQLVNPAMVLECFGTV
jgi:hypothetical protein